MIGSQRLLASKARPGRDPAEPTTAIARTLLLIVTAGLAAAGVRVLSGAPIAALAVGSAMLGVLVFGGRRAAIVVISLGAGTLTWMGVAIPVGDIGPRIPLPPVMVSCMALVTLLPSVSRGVIKPQWPLVAPALIIVGGAVAALWSRNTESWIPLLQLALGTIPPSVLFMRLRPAIDEATVLLSGFVLGTLASVALGLATLQDASGRAIGLTAQPNQFAMSCLVCLPIAWWLCRNRGRRWPSVVFPAIAALLVSGILGSGSRSGLLGLVVLLLVASWHRFGVTKTMVLSAGLFVAFVLVHPPLPETAATERLAGVVSTRRSDEGRLALMNLALRRIETGNEVIGVGFVWEEQPHNLLLAVWGGAGLIGLLGLFMIIMGARSMLFSFTSDNLEWATTAAFVAFLAAVSLNNLLGAPFAWYALALGAYAKGSGLLRCRLGLSHGSSSWRARPFEVRRFSRRPMST
jgi:hypothetical protein